MTREPGRMTRRRAERLLNRRGSRDDRLTNLVDAAVAPATPAELSRQDAALHEFRAAAQRDAALAAERGAPVIRTARRFTTRVGIAAATVFLAVTGLAVAAVAGALPARLQQPAHELFHAPAPSSSPQHTAPTRTSPRPSRTPSSPSSTATSTPHTSTVPSRRPTVTTTTQTGSSVVPSSTPAPPTSSGPSSTPTTSTTAPAKRTSSTPTRATKTTPST